METFKFKPSPQYKQDVFVYQCASFWKIGRGCFEDGRYAPIDSNYYPTLDKAILEAKDYAKRWDSEYIGIKSFN